MKRVLFFAALAASSALVSCQKAETPTQKEPIVFTASIITTKVSVDSDTYKVSWVEGDEITIKDETTSETKVYTADETGESTTFTVKSGDPFTDAHSYSATYGTAPSTAVVQNYSTTPGELIYMEADATEATSSPNFKFDVKCGLLKLSLTNDTYKVSKISVTELKYTSESDSKGRYDAYTYTLSCETAQDISEGKDFYIALPAGTYTKYDIYSEGTDAAVKTSATGTKIAVNQLNKVTFTNLEFKNIVYPETNTVGIKVGGYWWAPENCGYTADTPYGLLYQWAKKQGFNPNGEYETQFQPVITKLKNMSDGVSTTKFYYAPASLCWYTNCTTSEVWPTDKNYDPCPKGWRVPTTGELTVLTQQTNVHNDVNNYFGNVPNIVRLYNGLTEISFATGGSGSNSGGYWSSSADTKTATSASVLKCTWNGANMTTSDRGNGLPIRCVADITNSSD